MRKEVSATELQQKLGELLDGVHRNGDRLIVKDANKSLAAIVPIEAYEEMLQQREKAFSVLDRIWKKVPAVSEKEAQADIKQAIAEVRTERAPKGTPDLCSIPRRGF
ncbi:type II toxin-antitoxin system Phd/YefM family antitoxin [Candidatus Poribacteria bacterium]|nr:type II toxin-antitoxin system Phd/YefM family antitoxin [Candidatus Poribacteria bacterium]MYH84026.1 type II toxin-antitoxin system Phd/YefM family antitoxin [Candidatus Poribacteria bacterium]MYK93336.1 type II toxin-antitoxin system Phd/YefM family antitoxin [Candidatus Poribacteria bacterium]